MSEQIYQYLLEHATFDLPMSIVADQSVSILRRQYADLLMRGLSKEKVEEQMGQLQANSDQQAHEQLKTFFVMDKIAKKFEIDVTEEEINGHIAQLAIQRGQRPERMRQDLEKDGSLAQFKIQLRDNKCVAKLLESAKITEIEPKKTKKKATKKTVKKQQLIRKLLPRPKKALPMQKKAVQRAKKQPKRKPRSKNTRYLAHSSKYLKQHKGTDNVD